MFAEVLAFAWPIMLSYVAVGLACGVLAGRAGFEPWMSFVLGCTVFSGAAQFMAGNLWIAGTPAASIAAVIAGISARFALYSASLAPKLNRYGRGQAFAVSATFSEESYGMSLEKIAQGEGWSGAHALALNLVLMLTWATSAAVGNAVGAAVDVPTALASFACTSMFIYLLVMQGVSMGNLAAAAVAAVCVFVLKAVGASAVAVPVAAAVGVLCALGAGVLFPPAQLLENDAAAGADAAPGTREGQVSSVKRGEQ